MQTQPHHAQDPTQPKTSAEYMERLRAVDRDIAAFGAALYNAKRSGVCEITVTDLRERLEAARAEKMSLRCPTVGGVLPVCVGRGKGGKGRGFTVALDAITQGCALPDGWTRAEAKAGGVSDFGGTASKRAA